MRESKRNPEEDGPRVGADPLVGLDPDSVAALLGKKPLSDARPPAHPQRPPSTSSGKRVARRRLATQDPQLAVDVLDVEVRAEPERRAGVPFVPVAEPAVEETRPAVEETHPAAPIRDQQEDLTDLYAALRENPHDVDAALAVARRHLERGLTEQAVAQLLETKEFVPDSVETALALGSAYGKSGAYGDAEEELRRALRLDPDNAQGYCELGIVLAKKGLYPIAMEQLRRSLDLDPEQAKAHFYLGISLNHVDDLDAAAQEFERAIEHDPDLGRAYYYLGIIWDRKGRTERAREMYRQAREVERRSDD